MRLELTWFLKFPEIKKAVQPRENPQGRNLTQKTVQPRENPQGRNLTQKAVHPRENPQGK